jgi:hypothetical protein
MVKNYNMASLSMTKILVINTKEISFFLGVEI